MTTYTRRFDELGAADVELAGGKGANLGELTRAGLPVPPGFVVVTPAYDAFVATHGLQARIDEPSTDPSAVRAAFEAATVPEPVAAAVWAALAELGAGPVAVRSSATVEDVADASAAGQQDTYLNVEGPDAVLDAVVRCWASLFTDRALAYRARHGIAPEGSGSPSSCSGWPTPSRSGVMFTANPSNGRRDQLVIGAAWGLGESVVGGTVSTDDHVVDTASGAVLSRTVADKAVMTVPTATGTEERPVPPERRRAPVLDDDAVRELAALGARIAEHYGVPQDVEWVRTATMGFVIVQSRPVTALPEPMADPPTAWPVPYEGGWYFRASIVEQMPDPLTPLFADLVDGSVTRSLTRLMNGVMGEGALRDGDVSLPDGERLRVLLLPRRRRCCGCSAPIPTARAGHGRAAGGGRAAVRARRMAGAGAPGVRAASSRTGRRATSAGLTPAQRYDGVVALLDAGCTYYTSVQSIIPLAATSELAFRAFHDRLVRRGAEPAGYRLLLGFDSKPMLAEKSLFDLATAARDAGLDGVLTGADGATLAAHLPPGPPPDGVDPDAWARWCARLAEHLDRYGHTVYNLDFADPVPADDPAPLLDAVRFHLLGPAPTRTPASAPRPTSGTAGPGRSRAGWTRCAAALFDASAAVRAGHRAGPGGRAGGHGPGLAADAPDAARDRRRAGGRPGSSGRPRTCSGCTRELRAVLGDGAHPGGAPAADRRAPDAVAGPTGVTAPADAAPSTGDGQAAARPVSCRPATRRRPGHDHRASAASVGPGHRTGAGAGRPGRIRARCSPARCWSRGSRRPRGRRCSPARPPWSPTSAAR